MHVVYCIHQINFKVTENIIITMRISHKYAYTMYAVCIICKKKRRQAISGYKTAKPIIIDQFAAAADENAYVWLSVSVNNDKNRAWTRKNVAGGWLNSREKKK